MKTGFTSKKGQKVDTSVCIFGWQQLARHTQSFINEIDGAKKAADIEPIHQLRVFSRRISTTLRLFDTCFPGKTALTWRKSIRKTARSLGEVRDLDVQIEFVQKYGKGLTDQSLLPGIARLDLRLSQRRTKLQKITILRLEDLEKSGVLNEIQSFVSHALPPQSEEYIFVTALYRLSQQSIEKDLANLLSYDDIVLLPEKVEELHKMRIAAKSLRYTIEVFASIYPDKLKSVFQAVRLTQEMLGSIHDLDVWKQFVPDFILGETRRTEKYFGSADPFNQLLPGLQQFGSDVGVKRDQTYDEFTQTWLNWKKEGLWDSLATSVETA